MDIFSKLFDTFSALKTIQLKIFIIVFLFTIFVDIAFLDFIPNLKLLQTIAFSIFFNILVLILIAMSLMFVITFFNQDNKEKNTENEDNNYWPAELFKICSIFSLSSITAVILYTDYYLAKHNLPSREFSFIVKMLIHIFGIIVFIILLLISLLIIKIILNKLLK